MPGVKILSAFAFVTTLAACGGGSSGGDNGVVVPPQRSFAELTAETNRLSAKFKRLQATPVENMPTAGTARYTGIGGVAIRNTDGTSTAGLGEARVDADFARSTISGRINQIKSDPRGAAVSGEIGLNGTISRQTVIGTTSGKLTVNGEAFTTNTNLVGTFAGNTAGAFGALGEGTAVSAARRTPVAIVVATEKQ
ncbi:transferrin-binding protein-like solute binding protein [Paracoccus pacificus]|uniref:Transferrin-binding protein-like solute binding protein n=1 Tax=Paracoccus pacificus TaxID=1463598 RepID=A0ABW4R983_9RHOB